MSDRFEYRVVHFNAERWTVSGLPNDLNELFDEYGSQGWELVGTEAIQRASLFLWGGSRTVGVVAFFKRRLAP